MNRSLSLRRGAEFQSVWEGGKSWSHPIVILRARANGIGENRFGFVAGKKIGTAVRRNRAKRLLREAVVHRLPTMKKGWDLVFIARSQTSADYKTVDAGVEQLLRRARLISDQ